TRAKRAEAKTPFLFRCLGAGSNCIGRVPQMCGLNIRQDDEKVGRKDDQLKADRRGLSDIRCIARVRGMLELLTSAEMSDADRRTITGGTPGVALMEAAGRVVADAVSRLRRGRPVTVVCGPGNNGGDGFVLARMLAERNTPVRMMLVGERAKLKGDAAMAAARWAGAVEAATPDAVDPDHVVVDALFGAGLDREVTGLPRTMIEAMRSEE